MATIVTRAGKGSPLTHTELDANFTNLNSDKSETTHNHTLDSLSNVTITTNSAGEILKWSGTAWINNTLAEAGIAASGHAHTTFDRATSVLSGANVFSDIVVTDGITTAISTRALTAADIGAATSGHNHTLDSLSNVTITTIATGEILKWSGTAWINNTLAEAGIAAAAHTHDTFDRATSVLSGANVFSDIVVTDGIVTAISTRALTAGDVGAATSGHNHSGVYQPVDADLTAIAALAGTSGFLKKTAADTWTLDTSTYGTGTVTSVSGTGTVSGLTLTGTVTGSGSLTLGGTLSVATSAIASGNLGSGVLPYATASAAASAFQVPFLNTTGVASGNFGLLLDSASPMTYTPSTGTLNAVALSENGTALSSKYYLATNPSGYTTNTGTVTSVGGTGTVGGITLTGTVTGSGNLTLGGSLTQFGTAQAGIVPASGGGTTNFLRADGTWAAPTATVASLSNIGDVTITTNSAGEILKWDGAAWVNNTLSEAGIYATSNPAGYTTNTGTVTSVGGTGTVSGLTLTGTVTTSGNLTLGGTLSVAPTAITSGNLGSGVLPYATASSTASAFTIPFLNTTGVASGNFGLLIDSASPPTYNPSTNTLSATNLAGAGANITAIAEANITDGTILARVASNETISGNWTFSSNTAPTVRATSGTTQYTVGYRNTPQVTDTTISAANNGMQLYNATGVSTATGMTAGDSWTLVNSGTGNITITQAASTTMYLGGTATTGNRTLAQKGVAFLTCIIGGATPSFIISGTGVT